METGHSKHVFMESMHFMFIGGNLMTLPALNYCVKVVF